MANSSTTTNATIGLPATLTPRPIENDGSGPMAGTWRLPRTQVINNATWIIAKSPNPSVYPATTSPRATGVAISRSSVPPVRSRRKLTPVSRYTKK